MSTVGDFVSSNWKWIITVLIGAGVLFNQFQIMQQDVDTTKRRLQNYIERNRDQEKLIHDLELRIVILETTE